MNKFDQNRPCNIDELQNIITSPSGGLTMLPSTTYDEICEGLLLGEGDAAKNISLMKQLGVTHVLNAAMGKDMFHVNTNHVLYQKKKIKFLGLEATDMMNFDMSKYFHPASDFIHEGLLNYGKVFVHCVQGVSRSATLVVAYFMIKKHMIVQDAVRLVRSKREISPNPGFLQQLCDLNEDLKKSGHFTADSEWQSDGKTAFTTQDLHNSPQTGCKDNGMCTPQDLEQIIKHCTTVSNQSSTFTLIDECIALGDSAFLSKSDRLQRFGITHILNAAFSQEDNSIKATCEEIGAKFLGLDCQDDIASYFETAADFIDDAANLKGCVFIYCQHGSGCPATLVIAYLMIKRHLTVQAAVLYVCKKCTTCPNVDCLHTLCDLNFKLYQTGHFA